MTTSHVLNFGYIILFYFFNIIFINEEYLRIFNTILQLLVCLFLMLRYYPRKSKMTITENDSDIIFNSAIFLFVNLGVVEYFHQSIKVFIPV